MFPVYFVKKLNCACLWKVASRKIPRTLTILVFFEKYVECNKLLDSFRKKLFCCGYRNISNAFILFYKGCKYTLNAEVEWVGISYASCSYHTKLFSWTVACNLINLLLCVATTQINPDAPFFVTYFSLELDSTFSHSGSNRRGLFAAQQ